MKSRVNCPVQQIFLKIDLKYAQFMMLPKMKLPLRPLDRLLDSLALSAVLVLWAYVIMSYRELPAVIPTHFNFKNEADGYGSRLTLFAFPVLATVLFILFNAIIRFPHNLNYPVKITNENAERHYKLVTRLFRVLSITIPLAFLIATFMIVDLVKTGADLLGPWTMPIVLSLILFPLFVYLLLALKRK